MERKEYVSLIKELNGYCDCKELVGLYDLRKKIEGLDEGCYNLENSISDFENPKKEDKVPLMILSEKKKNLEDFVNKEYYPKLNNFIKEDKLKLYHYDEENNYAKKEVSSNEAIDFLEKDELITINCSGCEQQISLANSN